uniref:methionine biosynthesis protein MetW n=1 Tax=Flavobacterium sp. TaxID=239 RepID=UPI00404B833B
MKVASIIIINFNTSELTIQALKSIEKLITNPDSFEMLKYLPKDSKKVLDIGCGNGCFAEVVKTQNKAEVWGIELMTFIIYKKFCLN